MYTNLQMKTILRRTYDVAMAAIDSTGFLIAVVIIFVLHAGWLAYSGVYPLPFDEYYHFGIISIYAQQWSPFIHTQPLDATLYGDITRMTSYLYHYLMSFPYRFFDLFMVGERSIITALRFINIAMVVGALVLFRRFLLDNGISKKVVHLSLALFALTPIVPLLAAHINYDNLMLLLAPVVFATAMNIVRDRGNLAINTIVLLAIGFTIAIIKDTFAPLFAITTAYVAGVVIWRYRKKLARNYGEALRAVWSQVSFAILLLWLVVAGALFIERYVMNQIRYGDFRVACDVIQPYDDCLSYSPFYRNEQNLTNKPQELPYGIGGFTEVWLDRIARGYYATFSHAPTQVQDANEPYGPILLKNILAPSIFIGIGAMLLAVVAILHKWKEVWREDILRFAIVLSGGYVLVIYLFNFLAFLNLGQPQAVQARYTLPVLVLWLVVMITAVAKAASVRWARGMLLVLAITYLLVGGTVNRLIQTDEAWLWPDEQLISMSHSLRDSLSWLRVLELVEVSEDPQS